MSSSAALTAWFSLVPVFLLTTKAGGVGINLTTASVVILFDPDFNPYNNLQAQDRAYQIGQMRDVNVFKLIMHESVEENMLRTGHTKLALGAVIVGNEAQAT